MTIESDQRRKVAEFLLRIKAIQLRPNDPFTWASGRLSPIYCDNRKILSHPAVRTFVRQLTNELIEKRFGKPDGIAGVATGGIALGALVAQEMGLPFATSAARRNPMARASKWKATSTRCETWWSLKI